MAGGLYTPESLGIAAPAGGFQTGGWYAGRQYWNGTLSDPGVVHPSNPNQGGTTVNPTVVAATDVNQGLKPGTNEAYIVAQTAKQNASGVTPSANVNPSTTPATSSGSGVDLSGLGGTTTPALNLPDLYNSLSKEAGISDLENELTTKETAYNAQQTKINDNPWLSESDRTGRISKLTTDYNNDIKTTQDSLAMKKQDIQTQLDLQTKQFDINSTVAKQALDQFNTLLSSGALAGASGSDIAAITKSTGISSSMIQAAISTQTEKDTPTSLQTIDDGTNQYAVVINSKTGKVISKQVIAKSKPTVASMGGTVGSTEYKATQTNALNQYITSNTNSYGNIGPDTWNKALNAYLNAGLGTRNDFILTYAAYADPNRGDFETSTGYNFPKSIRDKVVAGLATVPASTVTTFQ